MKEFISDDTHRVVYESVGDFFKHTDPNNPPATMHSSNKSEYTAVKEQHDRSWRYGDDKDREKFYFNRFEPVKGKKMCEDAVKKTMADKEYRKLIHQARSYRKKTIYEDHGFRLSVPKAIAGEDRVFGVYKNTNRPTVKIAINISGSACVNEEAFRKIASTAIPTIYALEQAGICTEVWYTEFGSNTHTGVSFKHSINEVKMKSAQQRFSWTTFAPVFCLGSFRESFFLSMIYSQHKVNYGLGTPMNDGTIKAHNNYGYDAVIGLNAIGPVDQVNQLFEKIRKSKM